MTLFGRDSQWCNGQRLKIEGSVVRIPFVANDIVCVVTQRMQLVRLAIEVKKNWLMGLGGGLDVSVLALYSDNHSSNPTKVHRFYPSEMCQYE